jgi:hypothetical protein
MSDDRAVRLDANGKASRAVAKPAALNWPFPVDRRLDQLMEVANEVGAATHRNELAAALIAASPTDGGQLLQLVIKWRQALTRDVVLDVEQAADLVELPRYRPGRRR